MGRKKQGDPRPPRSYGTVKLDVEVIRKAKTVASFEDKDLAEYLSDRLAPIVDDDLKRHAGQVLKPEKGAK